MPLVLIIYLGVYTPLVLLNETASAVEPKHSENCWEPHDPAKSGWNFDHPRFHQDVPGWRWLIPWPFRRGKYRIDYEAGDKDHCTGETFNGDWWYVPEPAT